MKHPLTPTLLVIAFFLLSQVVGLWFLNTDLAVEHVVAANGTTTTSISYGTADTVPRPQVEESSSFLYVMVALLIGTGLLLLLIKFKIFMLWRFWYFLSVSMAVSFALMVFLSAWQALLLGFCAGLLKLFKKGTWLQNSIEILIYTGIAVLLVPIMNLFAAVMLLIAISVYDMYAVWKSKHMVTLAEFQKNEQLFAGLSFPYRQEKAEGADRKTATIKTRKAKMTVVQVPSSPSVKHAILGGGDVAFPLIFSGVVMHVLATTTGKYVALGWVMVIVAMATISLTLLFLGAKKDRYYPAMPFLSAGCLIGLGIILLMQMFI
ncbi:hypothetical protein HZB02_01275 [Candidatus Woesearchaeota archaeon]|nr:hypothetical protein [Candidatus Woesearchaeota archaeon]